MNRKKLLSSLCCAAHDAAEKIMEFYHGGALVEQKEDNSPVTQADIAAHHLLVDALNGLTPDIPVISEESDSHHLPEGTPRFWLVDPLDGTKSFVRRQGAFTVNIGLIENGTPTMGIIVVPTDSTCYAGDVSEGYAWKEVPGEERQPISTGALPAADWKAVLSMSHLDPKTEAFIAPLPVGRRISASSSLKFCLVAEGAAHFYPRFGPTMEWDTAAGHAILVAAGGKVVHPDGTPYTYAKPGLRNTPFIACHQDCKW
jgi:3'(2'), 5'-bisphosphate nucleotidase